MDIAMVIGAGPVRPSLVLYVPEQRVRVFLETAFLLVYWSQVLVSTARLPYTPNSYPPHPLYQMTLMTMYALSS